MSDKEPFYAFGRSQAINTLKGREFASFIKLLGKYKSGGYYTFSSKDVKAVLDFKFGEKR